MNKIILTDNEIRKEINDDLDVNIKEIDNLSEVKKIIIKPLKDTKLEISYKTSCFKADIEIDIDENINFDLFELREDEHIKVKYNYNVLENSTLNITKFYDCKKVKEIDTINLNGVGATSNFTLKTISTDYQSYNLIINHNNKNTISNVVNSGVNLTGSIDFNVEGIVPSGSVDSELNQNNRIITFNDSKCKIDPKLLIEENDVVANHSALIGKFEDEELFYLMSRGIDYNSAVTLLVKGFLLDNLKDERLNDIIEKYWR